MTQTRWSRDSESGGPLVTGFAGKKFKVGDQVYARGLWLTPERVDDWQPPAIADLAQRDVEALLATDPVPEFLLLGTGSHLAHPPRSFIAALEARGIGVEVMDSRAAARAWGVLRSEGRWIVAALMAVD